MKNRTLHFAVSGAGVALSLSIAGRLMDGAAPAIPLDRQLFYNWLSLILSPASFLLRLRDPDGPVVPGLFFVGVSAALNALWYAFAFSVYISLARKRSASLPAAAGGAEPGASRRDSPSERLADRYEHRLAAEDSNASGVESAVFTESARH